ncbi:hypothetical protein [Streptomyces sp. NPDC004763]
MTRLVPHRIRRRLKRWRHARQWRSLEVYAFNLAPVPVWCRIRAWNDAARIWRRRPERGTTHTRYARGLAAGAACLAIAGIAVAVWSVVTFGLADGGYLLPVIAFLYGATFLGWAASRERAAKQRADDHEAGRS